MLNTTATGLLCCLVLQTCLSTLKQLEFPWPTWTLTYRFCSFVASVSSAFNAPVILPSSLDIKVKILQGKYDYGSKSISTTAGN
jgi:hypothetical protein